VTEISDFGWIVLVVSVGIFVALLLIRLADRLAVPNAVVFLVGAALLAKAFPSSFGDALSIQSVERVVVVALMVILFDGGLHIGLRRFRGAARPILALGVLGTFATAAIVAVAAHFVLGLDWVLAGLIGAAIAPTDPAVTFSVLGGKEIRGRSGTILEGEAGTNDPVGIALMIGMIEYATSDDGTLSTVASEFAVEMALGLAVGVAGAYALLPIMRRVRLTGPALYPLRVLAGAGIIYGAAAVIGGSGFLAVFVAGILLGDEAAPRKGEIESFHSSLAALCEIAAFAALGLSVGYAGLEDREAWVDGIVLAVVLAVVARPLGVGPLLLPTSLRTGERLFVLWGGLKGAVPILLGALAVLEGVDDSERLYAIVFVVVLLSVVVQGATMPLAASRLNVPMRRIDYDLAEVREFIVGDDSLASGTRIGELPLGERAWVGVLIRRGRPITFDRQTVLEPGDRVHVHCQPEDVPALVRIFSGASGE
jgi:cell volume regulation protein A